MGEIYNRFIEQIMISGINFNQIFINTLFAIAILIVGFFAGKIVGIGLKKISKKLEFGKNIRPSFIDLFIIVIRWAIYLVFISLALNKLGIALLTHLFTGVLLAIPSLVGALILIGIGFAIAIYLREVIEESEVTGWKMFSQIVFYFVLYVFGVYAIKTALLILDDSTTNWIIIVLTAAMALAGIISRPEVVKIFRARKE